MKKHSIPTDDRRRVALMLFLVVRKLCDKNLNNTMQMKRALNIYFNSDGGTRRINSAIIVTIDIGLVVMLHMAFSKYSVCIR